jgi:hypothetical protein
MWKNVFFESCILSALIFAGFYFNAAVLKDELYSNDNKVSSYLTHVSGKGSPLELETHISGQISQKESHISGIITPANTR